MASGTVLPSEVEPSPQLPEARYETFIENRLRQARRQVKGVDLAAGLLTLAVGTLTYLLAAALIDHWVVAGGLGFWGRLVLFVGLLGAAGWYAARRILPPLIHRINPIFAAHTIEQSRPTLKNSLINFLLLRSHRREMSPMVYRTVQHRAAADLSQVEVEVAVDRAPVIRLGYLLAAVLAVCCLYLVLSPKNPLISAARVIWPWARTPAPTRVTVEEVVVEVGGRKVAIVRRGRNQSVVAFRGEFVTVSAEVHGLRGDEPVKLRYSTTDRQHVDQAIPMTLPKDAYRHQCKVPPGKLGLQQDLQCYLTAGDCTTEPFTIVVQTAPAIHVVRIDYDYPDYTGLAARSAERQGDIRAIEGTEVTIRAEANQEIARAEIDFDCDATPGQKMKADNYKATARFQLRLNPDDPTRPQHDCYQLRFTDTNGHRNPRPIRHEIEVIPDLPPGIQLVYPQKDDAEVADDGRLPIRVLAEDPDYALSRVALRTDCQGKELAIPPLLDQPHSGQFQGAYVFEPARLGLKAGDRILYWAEAEDNKQPHPGRGETVHQWITIVRPERLRPPQEPADGTRQQPEHPKPAVQEPGSQRPEQLPQPEQPPPQDQPQAPAEQPQPTPPQPNERENQESDRDASDPQQAEQPGEGSQPTQGPGESESGRARQNQDQAADETRKPIDDETQAGDAFEEILKHRQEQQRRKDQPQTGDPQQQSENQQQTGTQQRRESQPQAGDQPQTGPDQPLGSQQQAEKQQAEKQNGSADRQPSGEQQGPSEEHDKPGAGGEGQPQSSPGAGEPSADGTGTPAPQEGNQPRDKKPGQASPSQPDQKQQSADSPSIDPKQSDSQSETPGTHSGGGAKGGGQQANQSGKGSPGSHTEAEDGASQSSQPGQGETGSRGGDQVETDQQTGHSARRPGGDGSDDRRRQPGGQGSGKEPNERNDAFSDGTPQENPLDGGQAGERVSQGPGAHGQGNPTRGGSPDNRPPAALPPDSPGEEPSGEDPNLEYARKATDLALEHLKDQADKADSDLLKRLGWSPQQAREFIRRWEEMKRAAARQDTQGEVARRSLDEALKSLGLRRGGTTLHGERTGSDQLRGMRESGRFAPPSDWNEWLEAYNRGVASGGR